MTESYRMRKSRMLAIATQSRDRVTDDTASGQKQHPFLIPPNAPVCIRLDLNDLKCFDTVDRQFEAWGVRFHNAIALHPSNPAFPTRRNHLVLMAGPRSGFLEATFLRPVSFVRGFVTSSRPMLFSAYGDQNNLLAQTELAKANLATLEDSTPANTQLSLTVANTHRVRFYAFDGQFTLDEFSFSF